MVYTYHERKERSHRGFYSADRLMEGLALEWLRATIAGVRGPGLAEPVSLYVPGYVRSMRRRIPAAEQKSTWI